jgi:uncharacterized protein (DUF169 family)
MVQENWKELASEIKYLLNLQCSPIAITFSNVAPLGVSAYKGSMPDPTPDGRTGKVPAGCVFWMEAAKQTFTTVPGDHGNCSVGSLTHGLKTLSEVIGHSDVSSLIECNWVTKDTVIQLPVVKERPKFITYGPLEYTTIDPDVILVFINAMQAMILSAGVAGLRVEGKPQCHIIAIAKEQNEIALSVGCMLSRVRTGMASSDMTCAIPARRLSELVILLKKTRSADSAVANYASEDMRRFSLAN